MRFAMTRMLCPAMDALPPVRPLKVDIRVAEAALLLKTLALAVLQATTALEVSPQPVYQVHGLLLKRRPAPPVKPATSAMDQSYPVLRAPTRQSRVPSATRTAKCVRVDTTVLKHPLNLLGV